MTTITMMILFVYLSQEKMKNLGKFILIMAIIITLCGMMNPISMSMKVNIIGLRERLVIYTLQILIFVLSFYYTRCDK